jgi:hypothetical protein
VVIGNDVTFLSYDKTAAAAISKTACGEGQKNYETEKRRSERRPGSADKRYPSNKSEKESFHQMVRGISASDY